MPCERVPLKDASGRLIGYAVACRTRRHRCQGSPGCTGEGRYQCDYPVTRKGKAGTCDVYLCESHRRPVLGVDDSDLCPAHDRLAQTNSQRATESGRELGAERGAAASADGAHHASSTMIPRGAEAPGNAGGGTAAAGPGAEPPGVASARCCRACGASCKHLLCRTCWRALPAETRAAWYAARSTEDRRAAVRALLEWSRAERNPKNRQEGQTPRER